MNAGSIVAKCYVCDKEFKTSPSRAERTDRQTCSRECADKMKGERSIEKRTTNCCVCGAVFTACYRQIKNKTFYCSRKCASLSRRTGDFPPIDGLAVYFDAPYLRVSLSKNIHIPVHRYVAAKFYGEEFISNKHVHHIDLDVFNNDISNLAVLSAKEHMMLHRAIEKEKRFARILNAGGNPLKDLICSNCGELKQMTEFRKRKDSGSGYSYRCKKCLSKKDI